jgi:hypothetical protein
MAYLVPNTSCDFGATVIVGDPFFAELRSLAIGDLATIYTALINVGASLEGSAALPRTSGDARQVLADMLEVNDERIVAVVDELRSRRPGEDERRDWTRTISAFDAMVA